MCGLAWDVTALEVGGAGFAAVCRAVDVAARNTPLPDGGGIFVKQAFNGLCAAVEVCLVGDGRVFQEFVAGDGEFGCFAVIDFEARDGKGCFFAGE